LIEAIRSLGRTFSRSFWRGVSIRLERHIGLDVKLETGTASNYILLGLQFKKPRKKEYDFSQGEYYYTFRINDNSANDQHIILWLISTLVLRSFLNKFVFIGYSFPMFISHAELGRYSPDFLNKTIFIDASRFPVSTLDRLEHEVLIYKSS